MNSQEDFMAMPSPSGFVHASGRQLLGGNGKPLLLRGVGLGNWLLPEGYMWKFGPGAESPREIEKLVLTLLGAEASNAFWNQFRENFISEKDIALISASNFDHIRLPINSRIVMSEDGSFLESGFCLIDTVINWCRKYGLLVLLDLHGAPGGQTGTNIDDSPNGKPELFMDERYWDQTVRLWQVIAARYAKDETVLGYDLLNEPLPNEWQDLYAEDLVRLYREITEAIRAVDADHLIMYEGTHWASNWEIFTEVLDPNSALQFHKYWNAPDLSSIQRYIDTGVRLNLPIYMGESGENNVEWLYTAFRLFESQAIGWNFWPWKKIDTNTSPLSIKMPTRWSEILEYLKNSKASIPVEANAIFVELLENMKVENCVQRPEVLSAIFASSPELIPAWGYGFRGEGESYQTRDYLPVLNLRLEDSVTTQSLYPRSSGVPNFEHNNGRPRGKEEEIFVHLEPGDWLEYELETTRDSANYEAELVRGDPSSIEIESSLRGFRVKAKSNVDIVRFAKKP